MKMTRILIIVLILLLPKSVAASSYPDSLQLRVRAGYSIGGTAPIGMPATIRSIDAFRMTPSVMAGLDIWVPLKGKWGAATGLRFENKAMNTEVTTKGYRMELVKGDSRMEGLFTGHVKQEVTEWMFTLPLQAVYSISRRVMIKAGPYLSLLLNKDFSGIASDGYLRQGDPTGAKIIIGSKDGEWATYDFSDQMRPLQFGLSAGTEWRLTYRIGLSCNVNWGLTGIFNSDFKTVEQTLYPIYGTVSVSYRLK